LVTFLVSFSVAFEATATAEAGPRFDPSALSALVWPLILAVLAGFGGGLSTASVQDARTEDVVAGPWHRRVRGALAGGWRMLWLGLGLSFLGVLVLSAVKAGDTRTYLQAVADAGVLGGAAVVGMTLLAVPNLAAWVLYPSMGGCVGVSGPAGGCLVSLGGVPAGFTDPGAPGSLVPGVTTSGLPAGYVLFLLAPLIAVLSGGAVAARRGAARTRGEGAILGAGAGVVFGALSVPAALLAQIVFRLDVGATADPVLTGTVAVGPFVIWSAVLALGWGVAGGAAAGWVRSRSVDAPSNEATGALTPNGEPSAPRPAS
jgi:hypothetical protein